MQIDDEFASEVRLKFQIKYFKETEAFVSRFNPEDDQFAVGYADGMVNIYSCKNGSK